MSLRTAMEGERSGGLGNAPAVKYKSNYFHPKVPPFGRSVLKETRKSSSPSCQTRHQNVTRHPDVGESSFQPCAYYPRNFNPPQSKQRHQEMPYFFYQDCSSASTSNWPMFATNSDPFFVHSSARQEFGNYGFHHHGGRANVDEQRNHIYFPGSTNTHGHGTSQSLPYTSRRRG